MVSIQLPNWWQALALGLACWRRGAVLASVMTMIRSRELERMLARVRASVFITTDVWEGYQCAAAVAEMAPRLLALRHRVVLGEVAGDDEIDFVRFFQELAAPGPGHQCHRSRRGGAGAVHLRHHRGAQGVLRTLNNLYARLLPKLPGRDGTKLRRYTPQSLMHVLGLWSISLSLITGGAALLVDRWEPRRVARLLAETGMEQVILVPSFLGEFLAVVREDGIRLPRLREITVGGTAVSPELVTETAEVLGLPLLAQWGMTEGGLILTSPEDPPDWAARSIGRPGAGTEAELRPAARGRAGQRGEPGPAHDPRRLGVPGHHRTRQRDAAGAG